MKKLHLPVLLATTFFASFCYGQGQWDAGYIIKNQNDTVCGLIESRGARSSSDRCYFKTDKKGVVQEYTPRDLAGYRFTDSKYFVSRILTGTDVTEPVFLEFLIKGRVNVYHMRDQADRYFVEKDSTFYELKNTEGVYDLKQTEGFAPDVDREYIVNRKYVVEKKEYIGTLGYLLQDAHMQPEIEQTSLHNKSLINIARKYHQKVCTDEECIIYERKQNLKHFNIGVFAGGFFNNVNFGGFTRSDYRLGPFLGCRFELKNIIDWEEKLSFVLDLGLREFFTYTLTETEGSSSCYITYNGVDYTLADEPLNALVITSLDVNLKALQLTFPISLSYSFSKGAFRPYISAGCHNVLMLSQNKDFIYHFFYNEFGRSIPAYQIGFTGKAGARYVLKNHQAVFAEFGYEYSQSMNMNEILRFTSHLFSFGIGYTFEL